MAVPKAIGLAVGLTLLGIGVVVRGQVSIRPLPEVESPNDAPLNANLFYEKDGVMFPLRAYRLNEQGQGISSPHSAPVNQEFIPATSVEVFQDNDMAFYRGERVLSSGALLPPPNKANDLFQLQLDPDSERMESAWSPWASLATTGATEPAKDLWTRFKALPNFGMAYDTGFISGGAFDVSKIALGKSHAAGQTKFSGSVREGQVPLSLLLDNQLRNVTESYLDQVQIYVEANNYNSPKQLSVEHLYGRVLSGDQTTLSVGQTFSLFNTGDMLPATLDQSVALIGGGTRNDEKRKQIRLQIHNPAEGGWGSGVAIEDPYNGDFEVGGLTKLTRWPTFAGNISYLGEDQTTRLQFSGLLRSLGLEDNTGVEYFSTAWALSAYALIATVVETDRVDGFFAGVSAGRGVGQYVNGVSLAAVFSSGHFTAVDGLGAYLGYKQQWMTSAGRQFGTNVAYGYATMETLPGMSLDTNKQIQQAWANALYFPNSSVAMGVEYQYGSRTTMDDRDGENHRFMLVVALTTAPASSAKTAYGVRRETGGARYESDPFASSSSQISRLKL